MTNVPNKVSLWHCTILVRNAWHVMRIDMNRSRVKRTSFTFGPPSDDANATSEWKREHPPLSSSSRPSSFPHCICLREGQGEELWVGTPLPKHHSTWHVHVVAPDKEKQSVPLYTISFPQKRSSLCTSCCFHNPLPVWRTSNALRCIFEPGRKTDAETVLKQERCERRTLHIYKTLYNSVPHTHKHWHKLNKCMFLHLRQCQFHMDRWRRTKGCRAQLAW